MIIIGENINSTRQKIQPILGNKDTKELAKLAKRQAKAGAAYIDLNCATLLDREPEILTWAIGVVEAETGLPVAIDTPNAASLIAGLDAAKNRPLLNSITLEKERFEAFLPVIRERKPQVIGLVMSDAGVPESAQDRIDNARQLVDALLGAGLTHDDIYIDAVVAPVGAGPERGPMVLDAVEKIRAMGVHVSVGLSNVSYGLPYRKLVNRAFLACCMARGLDTAILDPLDKEIMAIMYATEAVLNRDEWCANYLQAHRDNRLNMPESVNT